MSTRLRYLVTLAQIPDEAAWCSCETLEELKVKLQDLWSLVDPVCKFYVGSGSTGSVATSNMVTEEEFQMWLRKDESTGIPHPMSSRLLAYDRENEVAVKHTADKTPMPRRPLLDAAMLQEMKAVVTLRHSSLSELVVIGDHVENGCSWGICVKRAQKAWGVVRPLLKYVDENKGERVIISILDASDFSHWSTHNRAISAELVVYEHAPASVLAELRRGKIESEIAQRKQAYEAMIAQAGSGGAGSNKGIPELKNCHSAAVLESDKEADSAPPKTAAERHHEKLAKALA